MNICKLILGFLRAKRISKYPREKVLALREKYLRKTLFRAYDHCVFYRDLWAKAGIKREELGNIPLSRLPIVDKKQIMENFEKAVTEPGISRREIESFIENDASGIKLYRDKYITLNTSGSSGYVGIFLFTKKFWAELLATLIARLIDLPTLSFLIKRVKVAFVGDVGGHDVSLNLMQAAPLGLFKTNLISILKPKEEICRNLNAFQPDVLFGYASSLESIAEFKQTGELNISPRLIISSGEPLTKLRTEKIKSIFGVRPINLYGATECVALTADISEEGVLEVFDDIVFVEVVDRGGNQAPAGAEGRVVITVFGNDIQPLVRYMLDDEAATYAHPPLVRSPFTLMQQIKGRGMEHLTFTLPTGEFTLHPMNIPDFFIPGVRHFQLVQTGKDSILLRLVADGDKEEITEKVRRLIDKFSTELNIPLSGLALKIEFVNEILPNPQTGKTPIILKSFNP